jgi:hypothetical protein
VEEEGNGSAPSSTQKKRISVTLSDLIAKVKTDEEEEEAAASRHRKPMGSSSSSSSLNNKAASASAPLSLKDMKLAQHEDLSEEEDEDPRSVFAALAGVS